MDIPKLKIGNLVSRLPIIQGGMGVGVSLSSLASAVARAGGIGIISTAQVGFNEDDFEKNPLQSNLRALKKHIKLAKENSNGGIIGVNVMVATKGYSEYIKTAIGSGIDLIISGAGMPTQLPKLIKGHNVKIAPIVSSLKAAKVILKLWDKHDNTTADMIVIEGPKAGGHLGFHKSEVESEDFNFDEMITSIIEETKIYENKYNKEIPVVVAGGIYTGEDIGKVLSLGAKGVQIATRFVATEECDASDAFKQAYINAKASDVSIVKSPVGMPGRALRNSFVKKTESGNIKVTKCYNCLTPCNPADTPYCISQALMNAVRGNLEDGLIFCGQNVSRIDKVVKVQELMDELIEGLANYNKSIS